VFHTGSSDFEHFARQGIDCRIGDVVQESRNIEFFSKPWSIRYCDELGIATPKTWPDATLVPADAGPVFYKSTREGGAHARGWATSALALPRHVRGQDLIFQEKIAGPEVVGFGFVARDGQVVEAYQHLELASTPPDGGSAIAARLTDIPRVRELSERLLGAFRYTGWGLVEFKFDARRNDYVFMELNPKLWASLELGLRTQPRLSGLLLGAETPVEPIEGLWWPERVLQNGPRHWLSAWRIARGLARSRETIPLRTYLKAGLPPGARARARAILGKVLHR
jgi:predicted ATP-grasp superfamily ATP-dependent carboligase